jgi:hypothetical protein
MGLEDASEAAPVLASVYGRVDAMLLDLGVSSMQAWWWKWDAICRRWDAFWPRWFLDPAQQRLQVCAALSIGITPCFMLAD